MTCVGALAFDESKYPDWKGAWRRVAVPGIVGQPSYDPTKLPGARQQAPLTPEYQAIYEAKMVQDGKPFEVAVTIDGLLIEVESAAAGVEQALADGRPEPIEASGKVLEALLKKLRAAQKAAAVPAGASVRPIRTANHSDTHVARSVS